MRLAAVCLGTVCLGTVCLGTVCLGASAARALDIKLWPLIDYRRTETGGRSLRLLGPLFAYERNDGTSSITLRPLFSLTRTPQRGASELAVLYPAFISRREREQTTLRLLGLVSYQSAPPHPSTQWERRFTVFPLVFYRHSAVRGTALSVLPFYADLDNMFGYERIQMIAFPVFLRLQGSLVERTWAPFPFVGWSGGTLGSGVRVFPFYGYDQEGEAHRTRYILWPFYVTQERHFTRPERERRLVAFPFYSSIESPGQHSRGYGIVAVTHSIDRTAQTDTWGFPWPFWVSQRDLRTGERTALRLAPFFGTRRAGDVDSRFLLWPLYRRQTQATADYRHTRRDAFLVLYRDIEDVQFDRGHHRRLRTLFPLVRAAERDGRREMSTPAVLDALFPRNEIVRQLYAPLWQLYRREQDGAQPARWSLLWDLVSSDGTTVRYPVHLDTAP